MDAVGALVRAVRIDARLTQRELAAVAGVPTSTVNRIETGSMNPTVAMVDRLVSAAGRRLRMKADRGPMTREEQRSWLLHIAVAARLLADPDQVLAAAGVNLAAMHDADDGSGQWWLDEWEQLVGGPLPELIATMVSTEGRARDLRPSSPFAGVLTEEERLAVIATHRRSEQECSTTSSTT